MQGCHQDGDESEPTDDTPEMTNAPAHQIEFNRNSSDLERSKTSDIDAYQFARGVCLNPAGSRTNR
jgi:hypothetical protein